MMEWKPDEDKTCYKCRNWEKIEKINHPQEPDEYEGNYCKLSQPSDYTPDWRPIFNKEYSTELHWLLTLIHEVDDSRMNSLASDESIDKKNCLIANICPLYEEKLNKMINKGTVGLLLGITAFPLLYLYIVLLYPINHLPSYYFPIFLFLNMGCFGIGLLIGAD